MSGRKRPLRLSPQGPIVEPMITIKITNVDAVVEQSKGWFVANVVGALVDLEPRVEAIIIERIREQFASQGIEAVIEQRE